MNARSARSSTSHGARWMAAAMLLLLTVPAARAGDEGSPCGCGTQDSSQRSGRLTEVPTLCAFINAVAADYLNDDVVLPHAIYVNSGVLPAGETAAFHVVGFYPGYGVMYNVTSGFVPGANDIHNPGVNVYYLTGKVKVRRASGSHDVSGKIRIEQIHGDYRIEYTPKRQYRDDRTAILTFLYPCYSRRQGFTSTFTLTIKGTG